MTSGPHDRPARVVVTRNSVTASLVTSGRPATSALTRRSLMPASATISARTDWIAARARNSARGIAAKRVHSSHARIAVRDARSSREKIVAKAARSNRVRIVARDVRSSHAEIVLKDVRSNRARIAVRDVRLSHVETVPKGVRSNHVRIVVKAVPSNRVTVTIARHAARVQDVSRTGSLARNGLIRRAARVAIHARPVSIGTTGRSATKARGSTAMTGPRVVRRTANRARIPTAAKTVVATSPGRSVDRHATLRAVRRAVKVLVVSTSRVSTGRAMIATRTNVRVSRAPALTSHVRIARRVAAVTGRNIRAVKPVIALAATTRTTARSSPSGRHLAGAANIANASPISKSVRRVPRRRRRNPANASPRSSRVRVCARAAMPRNGSCRAALR